MQGNDKKSPLSVIQCEKCGKEQLDVCDSRNFNGIRRRKKKCLACGHRITTYEISEYDYKKMLEVVNQ